MISSFHKLPSAENRHTKTGGGGGGGDRVRRRVCPSNIQGPGARGCGPVGRRGDNAVGYDVMMIMMMMMMMMITWRWAWVPGAAC